MKKNLYICFLREESETIGVLNKVKSQCLAINSLGIQSYLILSRNTGVVLYRIENGAFVEEEFIGYSKISYYDENKNNYLRKVSSLFRLKEFLNYSKKITKELNLDSVYIRSIVPMTSDIVKFTKYLYKSGIRIYWEIPTYTKLNQRKKNFFNWHNEWMLNNMQRFLTKIIAIAAENDLDRTGYLFTTNGVNIDKIKLQRLQKHEGINLACIATFGYWHGYDRLIEGLKEYYQQSTNEIKKVHLHMIGNGDIQPLQELVTKYNLNEYVTFHGVLMGEELDRAVDEMDIAIGNLGFHRVGVFADTSIKIREYCARGIPFVNALKDSDFPEDFKYSKRMSMDESPILINEIIEFYEELKETAPNYSKEMREFAENNLSWEEKMSFLVKDD